MFPQNSSDHRHDICTRIPTSFMRQRIIKSDIGAQMFEGRSSPGLGGGWAAAFRAAASCRCAASMTAAASSTVFSSASCSAVRASSISIARLRSLQVTKHILTTAACMTCLIKSPEP